MAFDGGLKLFVAHGRGFGHEVAPFRDSSRRAGTMGALRELLGLFEPKSTSCAPATSSMLAVLRRACASASVA